MLFYDVHRIRNDINDAKSRIQRKALGSQTQEVKEGCIMIKFIIFTPNVIGLFKSGRTKCEENVACMPEIKTACSVIRSEKLR